MIPLLSRRLEGQTGISAKSNLRLPAVLPITENPAHCAARRYVQGKAPSVCLQIPCRPRLQTLDSRVCECHLPSYPSLLVIFCKFADIGDSLETHWRLKAARIN